MIKRGLIGILTALILTGSATAGIPAAQDYLPGVAVFAVEEDLFVDLRGVGAVERLGNTAIDDLFDRIGAVRMEMRYPFVRDPASGKIDLRTTYNVYFPETEPVEEVCAALKRVEGVQYAEPWYVRQVFYNPNDPRRRDQYNLDLISAAGAHDINRGSREIVIGITDTGIQANHPDLAGNLWVNPGEDLNHDGQISQDERNNRDDENNGMVDDFYGWNFTDGNNNPNDTYGHGTHVSGIASAVTDNNTGIASVGFSCALMVVRIGPGPNITHGDQGIVYAGQNGAEVINCSWGGYQNSESTRQAVQSAYDNGALVVCAAGNSGSTRTSFPAGYDHAFSVAATNASDQKAGFSNYGNLVDISAPGVAILSTVVNSGYDVMDGTSMSSPLVAGAAGLFRAANPDFAVDDVADFLRFGADDISAVNPGMNGMLGGGRLNIERSLQLVNSPLVIFRSAQLQRDGNHNGRLDPGEAATIVATVANRGHATDSLFISISTEDRDVEIAQTRITCPNIARGEEYTNTDQPFSITIAAEAIAHTTRFRIAVTSYPGGQVIESDLPLLIGLPSILIVADDDGVGYERYLQQSVEWMRLGWMNWEVITSATPTLDTMHWFRLIIWTTGDAYSPLSSDERWTIQQAPTQGTNLLLAGRNIGDDPNNSQFLRQVFGAQHTQDSVEVNHVLGLNGRDRPFHQVTDLYFEGVGGSGDGLVSPSAMDVVRGADTAFVYKMDRDYVGVGGTYKVDVHTGAKSLYAGFTIEGITDLGTPRSVMLERLIGWFCPDLAVRPDTEPVARLFALNSPYPNPFNGAVRLNYFLGYNSPINFSIMDMQGRSVAVLEEGMREAGAHSLVWNAANSPSGVYFARLQTGAGETLNQRLILTK